ncbi:MULTISPECIES: YlxQ family RNA-binding protein [Bacillaceae]|jgi:ribosomal protein L7Ae-like RNA K-turn-binding protein|uniref:YlxQ family RNA-binding protein n=1 Tax=Bacillus salipaludis TaxID=2547811 RepID=A0A4R5W174_9BACI|nr:MULTISPECIES: YlxQ family RNA-binding protein [Bacillaceae]MBI0578496.1 YlxQ family RNA-binding protein [Neobacillus cucumis]MDQ6596965.1 YlxQ family RNA-binding protein [Bacillus salipaludis]MED1469528.1 YlxQ family RNA-binding protein [Bacillus salipaludis]TDK64824.1 YlxQ family RNA-binding protein [Bacillus salipaludis]WHY93602.1 YlxQ family RNA-binding protein [Neobacillus cucumis]
MNQQQWMSLLGLANRARKITSGEELTVKQIQSGGAKLILLSADASGNTTKKISDKCKSYEVPLKIVENRHLLGHAIGKEARVVVAVLDDGFAKKLVTLLD